MHAGDKTAPVTAVSDRLRNASGLHHVVVVVVVVLNNKQFFTLFEKHFIPWSKEGKQMNHVPASPIIDAPNPLMAGRGHAMQCTQCKISAYCYVQANLLFNAVLKFIIAYCSSLRL